jgi:hypothetical protein
VAGALNVIVLDISRPRRAAFRRGFFLLRHIPSGGCHLKPFPFSSKKFISMKKTLYLLFSLLIFRQAVKSQDDPLPRGLSDTEKGILAERGPNVPTASFGITDPPALPIRAMAKWGELQALVVVWRSQKHRSTNYQCRETGM